MGYVRLFRRVRIAPGITMNLSKSGPSLSLGVRGAHMTVGRSGVRKTVGLPGTGVFYTSHDGWHTGAHTAPAFQQPVEQVNDGKTAGGYLVLVAILGVGILIGIILAFVSR